MLSDILKEDWRNYMVVVEHRSGVTISYYTSNLDAIKDYHNKIGEYQKSAEYGMGKAHIMLLEIKKHELVE